MDKRKRVVLPIEKKLEIIAKFQKGHSVKTITVEYNIHEATVRGIIKKKDNLLKFACSSDSASSMKKRKTMKKSTYDNLDKALLEWFNNQRALGNPVNGPICAIKAKEFFTSLGLEGQFDASSGWLTRFKKRHGIRELDIQGEKLSCNKEAAEEFCIDFQKYVTDNNLLPEQVYNVDESGLYWKCLPSKTLAAEHERSAPGHKASKDRLTMMCCSNATGTHKLKLLIIGKANKPRSFKGTRAVHLPVHYYGQKKGWMNTNIFYDWFHKKFCPEVREFFKSKNLPPTAVLTLDNARSHPNENLLQSEDGKITVMYLPPNVTALIQPMDQGVIANVKRHYRSRVLKKLIDEGNDLQSFLKTNFTILDAIYECVAAWEKVKSSTLTRSWKKILPDIEEEDFCGFDRDTPADLAALAQTVPGGENVDVEDINDWLNVDSFLPSFEVVSDEDILRRAQGIGSDSESENEEEETAVEPKITYATARHYVEGLVDFLEGEQDTTLCDLMVLRKIRSTIVKKESNAKKQKSIKDFFSTRQ